MLRSSWGSSIACSDFRPDQNVCSNHGSADTPKNTGRHRRVVGGRLAHRTRREGRSAARSQPGCGSRRGPRRPTRQHPGEDVDRLPQCALRSDPVHARWQPELERTREALRPRAVRRCDYLFVHAGDGRRWFIPSSVVGGGSGILLGGPKYEAYEVECGRPLATLADARIARLPRPGGVPERSNGCGCKPHGSAFAGSNPAPATGTTTAPISTVEAAPSTPLGGDAPT